MTKLRILIVDDHPLMRDAIGAAIEPEPDLEVVAEAENGAQAVEKVAQYRPDVTIMDLMMPFKNGVQATTEILKRFPQTAILAFTGALDEKLALEAVQSGVAGYLVKDTRREDLLHAIRELGRGSHYWAPSIAPLLIRVLQSKADASPPSAQALAGLTERELEVLHRLGQGQTNRDIAAALKISEATVRVHIHHIVEKLGLENRSQAVIFAIRQGES